MPVYYIHNNKLMLGRWISNMRNAYKKKDPILTEDRICKLNSIKMIWSRPDSPSQVECCDTTVETTNQNRFVFNITTQKEIYAATEQEAREKLKKEISKTVAGEPKVECAGVYDSEDGTELRRTYSIHSQELTYYKPTCPRGYDDCIWDPAYIKANNPNWYNELYSDKSPYEAAENCRKKLRMIPRKKITAMMMRINKDDKEECALNES